MVFDKKKYMKEYNRIHREDQNNWRKEFVRNNPKEAKERNRIRNNKRMENPEYVEGSRERVKKWREDNPKKKKKLDKEFRKNNKEKISARKLASKIPMDNSCNICYSTENLERHHWRYDQPLVFNTLCVECHQAQHGRKIYA